MVLTQIFAAYMALGSINMDGLYAGFDNFSSAYSCHTANRLLTLAFGAAWLAHPYLIVSFTSGAGQRGLFVA